MWTNAYKPLNERVRKYLFMQINMLKDNLVSKYYILSAYDNYMGLFLNFYVSIERPMLSHAGNIGGVSLF
jgi:hypothetical protein